MKTSRIQIKDYRVEYYDSLTDLKPVLFFAQGLGGSVRQWQKQIEYFKNKYRVIVISFQGHGNSSQPIDASNYSIEKYTEVALELLEKISIKSCIWIGNSMGGVIGYSALEKSPTLIKHLITNGTAPKIEMTSYLVQLIGLLDRLLIKILGFEGYVKFASRHATKIDQVKPEIYDFMKDSSRECIIASHKSLGHYNFEEVLKDYNNRISIIRCSKDKDINKYINKCDLEGVDVIDVPAAGHIFNVEKSKVYNEIIEKIIEKNE